MSSLLRPEERVLPTLNNDGTRRWIRPRPFKGRHYRQRLILAWSLIAGFVLIPFIRMNDHPIILLDVPQRQFHLFGRTFLPTDGVLLMLLLLSVFIAIILLSALFGRVWCGWGCPQTVYMEFLFRPIERLIEGGRDKQRRLDQGGPTGRRVLKYAVFLALSALLGNLFLAYFVGVDQLRTWVTSSPFEHPTGFLVMAVTGGLVFFDFAYFREQMCTVICPYAKIQSVLLDKKSLIVAYDEHRGEPRGRKGDDRGDCVDCGACVVTCPTGIDIRQGLQLECIACTQCIDACNQVMTKMSRRPGLIRYTSQDALERRRFDWRAVIRVRTIVYPAIFAILVAALVVVGGSRTVADLTLLRGIGAPFVEEAETVRNHVRVKVHNRTRDEKAFRIVLEGASGATLIAPENPLRVGAGELVTSSVFVVAGRDFYRGGTRDVQFVISDGSGFEQTLPYKLLGPTGGKP